MQIDPRVSHFCLQMLTIIFSYIDLRKLFYKSHGASYKLITGIVVGVLLVSTLHYISAGF